MLAVAHAPADDGVGQGLGGLRPRGEADDAGVHRTRAHLVDVGVLVGLEFGHLAVRVGTPALQACGVGHAGQHAGVCAAARNLQVGLRDQFVVVFELGGQVGLALLVAAPAADDGHAWFVLRTRGAGMLVTHVDVAHVEAE